MKILRISLSNLASLGGLHTVDFTRDPLRSSGLFSISGPTGSGKSTLLDALCLALYDDTPRLHQVGRLAELANGDRQNDPRSLLRRGTGEGFAEVAFVGVNDQSYTARWTVRRSRRLAEGTLQNVEMVLFKGHIEPGGEGQIEEGGRKTAVLKAIESRIGLTFQQFTRAVLLAQNDFATFLKSDDRERAEILQALTGTENFEEISKRVYSRCQSELKTLDGLHIQLAGLAPMDEPTRQAAELKHRAAIESLRAIEQRAALLQTSVDWYTAHRKLEQDKAAAENMWQDAVNADAAASPRRQTLQLTEEVLRDGRPLWDAERSASEIVARLSQACIQTRARSEALKTQRSDRVRIQGEATTKLQVLHAQQKENQPVLQYARKLDNTLRFRQSQLEQVSDEYRQASESAQRAAAALKIKTDERDTLLLMLDECLERRTKLIAVAAFSSERSRWTDRIDSLIQACSETKTARIEVEQLQTQAASLLSQLQIEQESLAPMTEALAAAGEALTAARLLESQFDANVLAEERTRLDALHDVLRQLFIHLRDAESLRQRATGIAEKIQHLEDAQTLEATPLDRIRQIELPRIEASISTAGSQLEFTIAAVSDHAKRLRESLQDNHECPVCGSTSHPYREHAPEEDVVAIKAARKFVRELEKQRDDLMKQEARLQSSIAVRASQLDDLKAEQLTAQTQLAAASFDATPDPAVQEILMLPEEAQLAACEERLLRLNSVELRSLAQREQKARDSSQTVRQTQSQKDQIERQVADIEQRLSLLSSDLQKIQMKLELAGMTLQKATESQTLADELLTDVWKCLPTSRAEFQQDANEFRRRFDQAMQEFVSIDRRLKEEQNRLEQATTEIRWLSDAAGKAETKLDSAAASLRLATEQRDEVHTERQLLFSGRSADDVEQKMENDLKSAQMEYENSAALLNELERQIAAAESELRRETEFLEQSRQNSSEAGSRRSAWVEAFSEHHGTTLTDEDFNHMLSRDSAWIDSERAILKQLDNAVAVSRGEVLVRSELLREHVGSHSPDRPEAEILAELAETQRAINLAKHDESEALGVLQIDDHRRRNNAQLLDKIRRQDAISDPWRKLNDLIGSADGSKFRMMAQRTTLDVLLSYANLQLSQFASRYALERIPESLNLIIMDRDMGDERRSVHSLSGGESFLVSLALALGLASLTSNRLRIESLFIDEGFGSLDPQTLNTAMSALMQLESQGRKVGVISHVTEMTDAIPVQIQVIRGRRGASRIVVPGCSRTDTDSQETSVASSRVPDAELATETGRSPGLIREISQQIIAILERESIAGKSKVSTKSIRQELQCDSATWQQAQMMIKDRITTEGRSLVLRSDVEKQP